MSVQIAEHYRLWLLYCCFGPESVCRNFVIAIMLIFRVISLTHSKHHFRVRLPRVASIRFNKF